MKKTTLAALLGLGAVLAGCTVPGMPADEAVLEDTTPVVEDIVLEDTAAVDAVAADEAVVVEDTAAVDAAATTDVVAPAVVEADAVAPVVAE